MIVKTGRRHHLLQTTRVSWRLIAALALLVCSTAGARAQFGLKCDSPTFEAALAQANFSDDIQAAMRAKCAFAKKYIEITQTFAKPGWSWDLLPKAQADVAELTDLANKAAELNFATHDPRALANIRNVYVTAEQQRAWLADQEKRYARHLQKVATAPPAAGAGVDASQSPTSETLIIVTLQDGLPPTDLTTLLDAYKLSIVEGPNADGTYKLRLREPLPPDQLEVFLESMRSQTKIVKSAVASPQ